jgi:CubicO group peptidase (beta-lactamase class C family)
VYFYAKLTTYFWASNLRANMYKLKLFVTFFTLFLSGFYIFGELQENKDYPARSIIRKKTENKIQFSPIDDSIKAISKRFYEETLLSSKFNGGILIGKNGQILFEAYNGLEELTSGKNIDSSTSFHLASTSKTFTGIAVLKLFDSLSLSIDEPIKKFIPNFPSSIITVRQLLNHRSGLPNYVYFIEKIGWNTKNRITNEELLNLIISKWHSLKITKADLQFEYSNTNYAILALIIEKISNQSFHSYIKKNIFSKIGMTKSFVYTSDRGDSVLSSFKAGGQKEPFMFLDDVYGDKNIYSTTRDLLKWDEALNDTNFLSTKLKEEAFRGYSFEKKGIRNYGLGWRLFDLPSGKKIVFHNGWWHGNNIAFSRLPQDSLVIIVLGNQYNTNIYKAVQISRAFTGYESIIEENKQ